MFIQAFFKSNLLNEKTYRFLQFQADEKEIIIDFLQNIYDKIYKTTETKEYKKLEIWEQEEIIVPFKAYKTEIKEAIKFWETNNKKCIKLTLQEFEYLMENCEFTKKILTTKNNSFIKVCVDTDTAESIREWALDELEIKGFDENYELNSDGKILEALVDLFYV